MKTTDEIVDCTFCENFLLCKKFETNFLAVCKDFVDMYEGTYEDNDEEAMPDIAPDPLYICSGVNSKCKGCYGALPHPFSELLISCHICENSDEQIVKEVLITNLVESSQKPNKNVEYELEYEYENELDDNDKADPDND